MDNIKKITINELIDEVITLLQEPLDEARMSIHDYMEKYNVSKGTAQARQWSHLELAAEIAILHLQNIKEA